MDSEDRRRVMSDLAIVSVEHWVYRFVVMLTLSVIVAVMGLSLNSAAVVIGAMLLAPLMQPVLATGAALSMALFTKSLISISKTAAATLWCIAVAYVISWILPDAELTNEVLSRTQPDIKDLVVALAAGAAGAYATVRADVSSSLPGVAVAVALVPPLGSVGITLEHGETALAFSALLLYITNLAAIIFASIVVFVGTGFVPPRRLSDNLLRLTVAGVGLTALVILITVPLYQASVDSINRNSEQSVAEEIVSQWLGDKDDEFDRTVTIRRDTKQVVVEVRGFDFPPDQGDLVAEMTAEFPDYDVPVQWIRPQQATTTTVAPPEPTEQLLALIRVAVDEWLATGGIDYLVDDVILDGSLVRIDAAGTGEPPDIDDLVPRLLAIDETLSPGLNWATLETVTEETVPSPIELTLAEMEVVTTEWAGERGLVVQGVMFDGRRVEIDVSGPREPDIRRLETELRSLTEDDILIDVYFTERQRVTTTTTTTIPPTTLEPNTPVEIPGDN